MQGYTWKNIKDILLEKIKSWLLKNGGENIQVKGLYEEWQIRFLDSTFTCYKNGTLYTTSTDLKIYHQINSLLDTKSLTKKFFIGLDETGKGEVIGPVILCGVIFQEEILEELKLIVGNSDTKKKHNFEYWNKIFQKINQLKKFNFCIEEISPVEIDKYNLNNLMDNGYEKILTNFLEKIKTEKCRIVLDDYGISEKMRQFLFSIKQQEIIISHNAEDKYLEAKVASLVSKKFREEIIKKINEEYQIENISVGSGNLSNKQTIEWLTKWYEIHKSWPEFVKTSFKTIREIEGKPKIKKINLC